MKTIEKIFAVFVAFAAGVMVTVIINIVLTYPGISELEIERLYYKTKWERCEQGYDMWVKVNGEETRFKTVEKGGVKYLILESVCDTFEIKLK